MSNFRLRGFECCACCPVAPMLASAVAVIMAEQDPTRTIAAEQLVFSGPLLLACLAGLYSERAVFDTGLEGKMLAGTFAAPRRPRLQARPGSAWAPPWPPPWIFRAGARFRLDHPSRRPDRPRCRHQFHRCRLHIILGQAWFPAGRARGRSPKTRASRRSFCPARSGAPRAGARAGLFRADLGPLAAGLCRVPMVPFTWLVLFRTRFGLRLRSVGENPAAVGATGISVTCLRYRAASSPAFWRARPARTCHSPRMPAS